MKKNLIYLFILLSLTGCGKEKKSACAAAQAKRDSFYGFSRIAVFFQRTLLAFGTAGSAHIPTEENHAVTKIRGFLGRQALAQLTLHLKGVLAAVGNAQAAGDADAVGIADVGRLVIDIPEN